MNPFRKFFFDPARRFYQRLLRPIAPEFHSVEHGGLFQYCLGCERDLLANEEAYLVEKVYSQSEVIYEYALCQNCAGNMQEELSKESKKSVRRYIKKHRRVKQDFSRCNFCLIDRDELLGYNLMGACIGYSMLHFNVPMLICEDCLEGLTAELSEQTRKRLDRFQDEFFPGPPGEVEDIDSRVHLLL